MGQKASAFLLGKKKIICSLDYSYTSWVQSLGGEDPLEEGMATHSSILACRIPWTDEPGGLQTIGSQRVRHRWSNLACMHALLYKLTCNISQSGPWSTVNSKERDVSQENQLINPGQAC